MAFEFCSMWFFSIVSTGSECNRQHQPDSHARPTFHDRWSETEVGCCKLNDILWSYGVRLRHDSKNSSWSRIVEVILIWLTLGHCEGTAFWLRTERVILLIELDRFSAEWSSLMDWSLELEWSLIDRILDTAASSPEVIRATLWTREHPGVHVNQDLKWGPATGNSDD